MSAPVQIPVGKHINLGGFLASIEPYHLVFFLLNVGDGDQQAQVDRLGTRHGAGSFGPTP
jgi:hypothetical protein